MVFEYRLLSYYVYIFAHISFFKLAPFRFSDYKYKYFGGFKIYWLKICSGDQKSDLVMGA